MLTMLLGGLWHGANWTFLIWGAHAWRGARPRSFLAAQPTFARFGDRPLARRLDWSLTFHFVCLAWIFFRAPSFDSATPYFAGLWTDNGADDDSGHRPGADRLGALTQIAPPDRARDRRAARRPRRRGAGRLRFRAVLRDPGHGAFRFGAVHLFPVLTGEGVLGAHDNSPSPSRRSADRLAKS